jgi:hypothetical protein
VNRDPRIRESVKIGVMAVTMIVMLPLILEVLYSAKHGSTLDWRPLAVFQRAPILIFWVFFGMAMPWINRDWGKK